MDDLDEFIAVLQDVVLPPGVPVLPGLDVGVHFAVPATPGESSGAWFDVLSLPSGRVALVVGQVPASGLEAASAAARVNAVLRVGLLRDEDVAQALQLADLFARTSDDTRGTSVTVAIVDPDGGDTSYATAGHAAPRILDAHGALHTLDRTTDEPLGDLDEVSSGTAQLGQGDVILVCSAAPTRRLDDAAALATFRSPVVPGDAAATSSAVSGIGAPHGAPDAIAVIAAELRVGRVDPLDVDLLADDTTVTTARAELGAWLDATCASPMDSLSIVHAALELVTNAVEHSGTSDGPSPTVSLRASHDPGGDVVVEVADHGRWKDASTDPSDPARGRGLAMAAGLVDELSVIYGEEGTRVRLRHHLTRAVLIERDAESTPSEQAPIDTARTGPGVLRLTGALGHEDVDRVTAELNVASRGSTQQIQVELSEVTYLSASGLRLLRDLTRRTDADDARIGAVLHARHGTAAQSELARAGIAHDES